MIRLSCAVLAAAWIILSSSSGNASINGLEAELSHAVVALQAVLGQPGPQSPSNADLLQALAVAEDELHSIDLLLRERFQQQERQLASAPSLIRSRHQENVERYDSLMARVFEVLTAPQLDDDSRQAWKRSLSELLGQLVQFPQLAIHGSLPYSTPQFEPISPVQFAEIIPAYRQPSSSSTPLDLHPTAEGPLAATLVDHLKLIAAQAGKQHWDPVVIYEWVKNNIATEMYHGCMKGALETLSQRSGNDADQAALLVALMRTAGYPSRYVRGVVELFPGLSAADSWFGVESQQVGELLTRAGVPHEPVYSGSELVNYRFEHIWVEVLVPYANYRGALADLEGEIWVPLDTSLKVAGSTRNGQLDIYSQPDLSFTSLRQEYLASGMTISPLQYLTERIENYLDDCAPGTTYQDLLHRQNFVNENLQILPSMLQFREVLVTGEYSAMPAELIHRVKLTAGVIDSTSEPFFEIVRPVFELSNRSVTIDFEPETVADHETINLWGGLDHTPPYLVRLRPSVQVDGQMLAVGRSGFAYGEPFDMTVTLEAPVGTLTTTNQVLTGYPQVVSLVAQSATPATGENRPATVIDSLSLAGLSYIDNWNRAEQELAELFGLKLVRPLPTLVSLGAQLSVVSLLGAPAAVEWRGLFIDADARMTGAVNRTSSDGQRGFSFMELSALQGAWLEGELFADQFAVDAISTVRLLQLLQLADGLLHQIDAGNVETLLPKLTLPDNIASDIRSAVEQGQMVTVCSEAVTFGAWTGYGYVKEDPQTGAAGYMLSGLTAGGYTILGRDDWPDDSLEMFQRPHSAEPNADLTAAFSISAVLPWDVRLSTAGEETESPLVVQVLDESGVPVIGAPVGFRVIIGGGALLDDSGDTPVETIQLIAETDRSGLARARFVPGRSTIDNPVAYVREGDEHANIAGQNLIAAQLVTGSLASLDQPMAILGFAGEPDPAKTEAYGNGLSAPLLSYVGNVTIFLQDRFGNPVANHPVYFSNQPNQLDPEISCPTSLTFDAGRQDAQLVPHSASCLADLPVYDECVDAGSRQTLLSKSDGSAFVGIILGSVVGATYPVQVDVLTGKETITRTVAATVSNSSCPGSDEPVRELVIDYLRREDGAGHNVDARPVDRPALVQIKSYLLNEGQTLVENGVELSCGEVPKLCGLVTGSGNIDVANVDQVQISGVESTAVEHLPGGTARAHLYQSQLDLTAEFHNLPVSSEASVKSMTMEHSCSACGIDNATLAKVGPMTDSIKLWGVRLDVPQAWVVAVDERGVTSRNADFIYTIEPSGYVANQAQVLLYSDDQLWGVFPAAKTGMGSVTLPTGYFFDPRRNYHVEVRLNNPGDVNEISSGRIPVMPQTSVAGLAIDGLPMDALKTVGAFVLLNNDFDEQDQDESLSAADAETPEIIVEDDELRRGWLHTGGAEMVGGSWHLQVSDPTRLRVYYDSGSGPVQFLADNSPLAISSEGQVIPLYLEGLAESMALQEDYLQATFVSKSGSVITERIPMTVMNFDMAIDGDRDRSILFDSQHDELGKFWINNDKEVCEEGNEGEPDIEDDAEDGDDSNDGEISCKRDLEDFARLQLFFGANLSPDLFSYSMQVVGEEGEVWPMLNIFPAASSNDAYLGLPDAVDADGTEPDRQLEFEMLAAVSAVPVKLPNSIIKGNGVTPLLFEGRKDGRGRLRASLLYLGVPVLQKEVQLDLWDISYFYDSFVLSETGDSTDPVNDQLNPFGSGLNDSRQALYEGATDEYVLYVHGWNMESWEKRRWAETVFKRLWWQGYQGEVGLFDWPCRTMPSGDFITNFDKSEYRAWYSARNLAGILEELSLNDEKNVKLLAHSQGNVVAAEAIRQANAGAVHTYVASQAALSASMFDGALSTITPELAPFTYETPDVYSQYPGDASNSPYFDSLGDRLTAMLSYYNQVDYALVAAESTSPCWETNNRTKPDGLLRYGYEGGLDSYAPTGSEVGFYQMLSFNQDDQWIDWKRALNFVEHDYEIYAFGAESRSRALGAVDPIKGFQIDTESIETKGSRDLALYGFDRFHYSHSRQFRSNVVDENPYWSAFVHDCEMQRTW